MYRETFAVAEFSAELEELVGGCEPLQLQSVDIVLTAEEGLIDERRIDKVPDVLMLVVQIAETREKATEFRCQAVARAGIQSVGLLDGQRVLGGKRYDEVAEELVVDIGGDCEFGFPEVEAALAGRDVAAGRETAERVLVRVLREVAVRPLQHR
jgi:hypothetical protein